MTHYRDWEPLLPPSAIVHGTARVVAPHPDDEIAFAGALYKTSTLLDGRCDVAGITNGEGGFKYSTLAERIYGLELTDEVRTRASRLAETCGIGHVVRRSPRRLSHGERQRVAICRALVAEPELLHEFGDWRGIDGMVLDTDGNIWATAGTAAGGPGPSIYVFSPEGSVIERHHLPVDQPTNCTFAGADLNELYVTTIGGHLLWGQTEATGRLWFPAA